MVQPHTVCVDVFRPGYPRYAALLSTDDSFLVCRKFTRLRARMLLLKQDKLAALEAALDKLDEEERCALFLGCNRKDQNQGRLQILEEIDRAMLNYDQFLENCLASSKLAGAKEKDVKNLVNWLSGNGCIAREESSYLTKPSDLVTLDSHSEGIRHNLESCLEEAAIWIDTKLLMRFRIRAGRLRHRVTSDDKIFVFGPWVKDIAKALMTWLLTLLILGPVVILNSLSSRKGRFATIVAAVGLFNFTMSFATRARTIEILASSAAYTAVLVVFTSANNGLTAS